jgi:phage-related protein
MTKELFDFGFTLVDENELEAVQQAQSQVANVSTSVSETQAKLDNLFDAVQPLLNNLKQNPSKEYILWPNRLEKIEQFEDHIQKIYKGE